MEWFVSYEKTLLRNQQTGYTRFWVIPLGKEAEIPEADFLLQKGRILCEGVIGLYAKGIPLQLTGTVLHRTEGASLIQVSTAQIPHSTPYATYALLDFCVPSLTETQKHKIATIAHNDLFAFVKQETCQEQLVQAVSNNPLPPASVRALFGGLLRLQEQEELLRVLLRHGMALDQIERLCKKGISLSAFLQNVYFLCVSFSIPLSFAEQFAKEQGGTEFSPMRLCGFVWESMQYLLEQGHTCCTLPALVTLVNARIQRIGRYPTYFSPSLVHFCMTQLSNQLSYHEINGVCYVYENRVWEEECQILSSIKRLCQSKKRYQPKRKIEETEKKLHIQYTDGQRRVFAAMQTAGVKLLIGPPGSGKTAVIRGLLQAMEGYSVCLAATTGRAATVLATACGQEATTLHKLLQIRPYEERTICGRTSNAPIEADLVLVDEVSMMGLSLGAAFLAAVPTDAAVLLVGDENQLQSVDYGNVLHDLIASGELETYRLEEIVRQSKESTIVQNAWNLCRNRSLIHLLQDDTFRIYRYGEAEEFWRFFQKETMSPQESLFHSQVLCPLKTASDTLSAQSLNAYLQPKEGKLAMVYGKTLYRIGDKIIMTRTNYEIGYYNGSMGWIQKAQADGITIQLSTGETFLLPRESFCDMQHAYAITIHKSQGSEFDVVHIVLPKRAQTMLSIRLLYTAITRAKQRVVLYSEADALEQALQNRGEVKRMTQLDQRLQIARNI